MSGTNAAPSLGDRQASEDRPHPRGTSTTSPLANPARSGVGSPWAAGAVAHEDAIDRGDTFATALLRLKSGSRRATAPRPTKLPKLTPGHPSSPTWCTWRGGWVAYAIKAMSGRVLNRRAKRQRPKLHAIERPRRLHHQHGGPVAGHCGITRLQHPARSACLLVRPWNSDSLQTTLVKRGAGLRKFRRPAVNECCTPDLAMQRARKPRRVQGSETRRGKIEFETCLCRARVQRPQVFRYPSCPGPPCGCPHAIQAPRHEPKGKKIPDGCRGEASGAAPRQSLRESDAMTGTLSLCPGCQHATMTKRPCHRAPSKSCVRRGAATLHVGATRAPWAQRVRCLGTVTHPPATACQQGRRLPRSSDAQKRERRLSRSFPRCYHRSGSDSAATSQGCLIGQPEPLRRPTMV